MLLCYAMTPNMGLGSSGMEIEGVAQGEKWVAVLRHSRYSVFRLIIASEGATH